MTKKYKAELQDRKGTVSTKIPNDAFRKNYDNIFKQKSSSECKCKRCYWNKTGSDICLICTKDYSEFVGTTSSNDSETD